MKNEKYLQFIASFLILLVLELPFYISGVNAQTTPASTRVVLKNIKITSFSSEFGESDIFKVGDQIAVTAIVTSSGDVNATADFSRFISGQTSVEGTCTSDGDEKTCTWQTDAIQNAVSGSIIFSFNSLRILKSINVFATDITSDPDYWESEVVCSPKVLDRQIGPLINQRIYCQVDLSPKKKSVQTVFISPATCEAEAPIAQTETFNIERGDTDPIIKVTFEKSEYRINSANLTCSFSIFSKLSGTNKITSIPETETVSFPLEFANLPLGEVSDEVQKKIDDAKKDTQGIWKTVGSLKKLIDYATKICQFINIIYYTVSAFFVIHGIFQSFANPVTEPARTAMCHGTEKQQKFADKFTKFNSYFCDYITCRKGIGPDLRNKIPTNTMGSDWVKKFKETSADPKLLPQDEIKKGKVVAKKAEPKPKTGQDNTNEASKDPYDFVNDIKPGEYYDVRNSLALAIIPPVCIPGVINGLDKFRQIKCLYADCLQNAVGQEGLPLTVCEDQKNHATCKYVMGEIFAVASLFVPWVAIFDHYMGLFKQALSNPFSAIGVFFGFYCGHLCEQPAGVAYSICRGPILFKTLAETLQNIKSIMDTKWSVAQDYCTRIDQEMKDKEAADSKNSQDQKNDTKK
ncbi:MAG TPA: hypothetical protein VI564_03175 [Candidatus Nanoarchaeia archaeon]|nr:hypothetical protein [Candidatus Nanoarchaeia archaeon]